MCWSCRYGECLKERLKRGHVDVTLQVERRARGQLQLNADLLEAYVQAFREAAELHGVDGEPDLNTMLRIPGVMSAESSFGRDDAAALEVAVLAELDRCCRKLNEVRAQEGEALAAELRASMVRLRRVGGRDGRAARRGARGAV